MVWLIVTAGLAVRREPDLVRAARVSGAGPLQTFTSIDLPLLRRPLLAAGAVVLPDTVRLEAAAVRRAGVRALQVQVTTVREDEQICRHEKTRDRVLQQAAAVDAGSEGLPVGVQVIARPWREDIVLAVMAAIERACPRPVCPFLRESSAAGR